MADLGKVVVTDGGTYSASVTYEKLTFVHYNGDAYLTLKTVKGVTPTDDGTNYRLFCKSAVTATTSKAGIVMPDGSTISISNGKISAKKATQSAVGVVKGSDDINVDSNGAITVNTEFTQATALANLISGEAIKVVLGKVSKAIATTMNLDQNALLKNMVSGIDANDGNKIPSSAFVHTLYERLGMGTDLSAGDAKNVTQAVNSLYSNIGLNPIKTYKVQDVNVETNTLQKWIINNFVPPVSILNIFNDKSAAMFDETGNFNIIAFGPHSDAIVILVVNHWTGHSWIIGGIDTANYGNWQWLKLFS